MSAVQPFLESKHHLLEIDQKCIILKSQIVESDLNSVKIIINNVIFNVVH